MVKSHDLQRGDIIRCFIKDDYHPVIVVSSTEFNSQSLFVFGVLTTSKFVPKKHRLASVLIKASESSLPQDSTARLNQIFSLHDDDYLAVAKKVGTLPPRVMRRIEDQFKFLLGF